MSAEAFGKKFLGALIRCLRQQLFDTSIAVQVYRLKREILSDATPRENAQVVRTVVGRPGSKIAGGVRSEFLKMRSYAICKLKNEFAP